MTTKKQSKRPRILGEGEPSIEVISELERVITYPDGLVVHETQNRPNNSTDIKWLVEGVVRILPFFLAAEEELPKAS
jgi:hypothetical protein